jgi:hypothetical protein
MAAFLTLHKATVTRGTETDNYFFLARPDIYTGDVATQTGVSEAAPAEKDEPRYSVAELLGKGILKRVVTNASSGSGATLRRKTHRMLVTTAKSLTVLDGLKGKSIGGAVVDSVGVPRRKSLH